MKNELSTKNMKLQKEKNESVTYSIELKILEGDIKESR
jgi:hypothetical protein